MTDEAHQDAYLERRQDIVERIDITLNATTKRRLERLAQHYGIKQREILARILADAESRVVESVADKPSFLEGVTA